jgi:hypothetical protein
VKYILTEMYQLIIVPDQHPFHGMDGGTGVIPAMASTDPYIQVEGMIVQRVARNQQYLSQSPSQVRPMSASTDTSATSSSTAEPDTDSHTKFNGTLPL